LFEKYDINSKFDEIQDTHLRTGEEQQKHLGLLTHMMLTNEDAMNKSNFKNCVNNYFSLNAKLAQKF
jgi:hypothetical protein